MVTSSLAEYSKTKEHKPVFFCRYRHALRGGGGEVSTSVGKRVALDLRGMGLHISGGGISLGDWFWSLLGWWLAGGGIYGGRTKGLVAHETTGAPILLRAFFKGSEEKKRWKDWRDCVLLCLGWSYSSEQTRKPFYERVSAFERNNSAPEANRRLSWNALFSNWCAQDTWPLRPLFHHHYIKVFLSEM